MKMKEERNYPFFMKRNEETDQGEFSKGSSENEGRRVLREELHL